MRAGIKSPFEFEAALIEPFARPMIQRLPDDTPDGWTRCFTTVWHKNPIRDPHGVEIQVPWDVFSDALRFSGPEFAARHEGAKIVSAAFYPTDVAVRRSARLVLRVGEKVYADVPALAFAAGFTISPVVCPAGVGVHVDVYASPVAIQRGPTNALVVDPPLYVHVGIVLPHVVR